MYTFLIGDDNTLTASVTERIMERSIMVDNMHFLADLQRCKHERFYCYARIRVAY